MSPLLEIEDLAVSFAPRRTLADAIARRGPERLRAVDGVSLSVEPGTALALVGESGSGKTTTAMAALGLVRPDAGAVRFDGQDLSGLTHSQRKRLRGRAQMIYQDPYGSLDPRFRVSQSVAEPLEVHRPGLSRAERDAAVVTALEDAGLAPASDFLHRFPHELSGGQRQRVAIAAALVLGPELLVADEPASMLDVSVQAGILALLDELKAKGLAILLITHDLSVAAHHADRVAIMYLGAIVEEGPTATVIRAPRHPYTRALIDAVPRPRAAGEAAARRLVAGEPADAARLPSGCRFHPRCPIAIDRCRVESPLLRAPAGDAGRCVACHRADDAPASGRAAA